MKRTLPFKVAGISLVFALAAGCAREREEREEEENDDATARRAAMANWYGEGAGKEAFTPEYRRFILEAAAAEKAKYPDLLPDVNQRPSAAIGWYWINLGPDKADFTKNGSSTLNVTDSGRLRSIVIDPHNSKHIYLATAAGGVWKTEDGGNTWSPMTESLGTLSCGSLAMDPTNSDTLYLGFGDPFDGAGTGLVKSVDGGVTWSAPQFLGAATVTPHVMVSRGDSKVVLAATNVGLFRSADAGATWVPMAIATGNAQAIPYVWSLAQTGDHSFALALEANHANLMGTTDGQIWVSADDGATWTRATGFEKSTGVGRTTLAAAPSNPQIVYAMAAVPNPKSGNDLADLFKSTDGGKTWTALNVTAKSYTGPTDQSSVGALLNGQGWYDQLVLVDPAKPDTVYFGGALALVRTTDGGATFSQLSQWLGRNGLPYVHADFHTGAIDRNGKIYVGSDGGLFRSTDGAKTWSADLNKGLTTHLIYSLGSSAKDPSVIIGGFQDNGTRIRAAGNSKTFNQVIGGDGFGSDVNETDPKQVLGSLYFGQILKSGDGAKSWEDGCTGIDECGDSSNAPFITRIIRWSGAKEGVPVGNIVYTFMNKVVYRSEDYASSWTKLGATGLPADIFIRGVGIAKSSEKMLGIVANGGRIFFSQDGGATWAQATTPTNSNKSMSDVRFDDANPTTVYLASVSPDPKAGHLWKSTDLGKTWSPLDGEGSNFPTGVPVNVIKQDPQDGNVLYAATKLGIYRSTDGGSTWKRFGWGLPLVDVTDLYISADSKLVRVSTFGRGFYELTPFRPRDPV